jgi:hypothetical protein
MHTLTVVGAPVESSWRSEAHSVPDDGQPPSALQLG